VQSHEAIMSEFRLFLSYYANEIWTFVCVIGVIAVAYLVFANFAKFKYEQINSYPIVPAQILESEIQLTGFSRDNNLNTGYRARGKLDIMHAGNGKNQTHTILIHNVLLRAEDALEPGKTISICLPYGKERLPLFWSSKPPNASSPDIQQNRAANSHDRTDYREL
jgi:hypothetical protein